MLALKEINNCGEELENLLLLRSSPIAVKMLKSQADIPKEAFRPKKDKNKHYGPMPGLRAVQEGPDDGGYA